MSPLAQPRSFDPGVLEALFDREPDVIAAVLLTFCASMEAQLQQLLDALASRDMLAIAEVAHRVKGAARMGGAQVLAQTAEHLEGAARSPCVELIEPVSAALRQQWFDLQQDPGFCQALRDKKAV